MLESIVRNAPVFLLVAVRCFALIMTLPLLSSRNIPRIAKVALAGYMAFIVFPQVSLSSGAYADYSKYITSEGSFNLDYIMLLLGEGMIGIIIGFYISIIFAAFSTAGQFFSFQMGFSASEVYDSMNQVENPLMGQYFNYIAMLVFLQNNWFQKLFLGGLVTSFKSLNAFSIVNHNEELAKFMLGGLTTLFKDALIIALPIMGTLLIINIVFGVMTKAAPQMNLMSEGFAVLIITSFLLILSLLPVLINFFNSSFTEGFKQLQLLFIKMGGGGIT
ncbi:MAG: flagellar biosynthetic protein FliR [Treponema sp.]